MGSRSAKYLALLLTRLFGRKVRRVRPDGNYRPKERSLIINYGSSHYPNGYWMTRFDQWLNVPTAVDIASNKARAFSVFTEKGIPTPEWTINREEAQKWIDDGKTVVCRNLLNAHSGRGIILASKDGQMLSNAPLYVLYKKKRSEYRVHVFRGNVIDVSEKRRRNGSRILNPDGYIRNLANGWVFCRDGIVEPSDLRDLATKAVATLGLDFGACDIIWNEKENKCYVLEVNTAPGLQGSTLAAYVNAIIGWIRSND